jgi:hypothetical protein
MIKPEDVRWGGYKKYEGAYYYGSAFYKIPSNPTEADKYIAVFCATEGGRFDGVNAYDKCGVSSSLPQWCEFRYFLTSKLLEAVAKVDPNLMAPLAPALEASGAAFKPNSKGRWRFHTSEGEVDTVAKQQRLFLLNSNGLKGSWDDESKEHIKLWVACLANTLAQPETQRVQVNYTAAWTKWFATPDMRKVLFDDTPSEGWTGALRAAALSFAGNLQATAEEQFKKALATTSEPKWSPDWCIHIIKQLTFGPQITIYPERYNKIRPVLEKLYGIDLPDFAAELKEWKLQIDPNEDNWYYQGEQGAPTFETLEQIQGFLSDMGYDLGPAGIDGRMGKKTEAAIKTFQENNGLVADGIVGPLTRMALRDAWEKEVCV